MLAEALRTTRDRRHWVRLRTVWLAAEGRPVPFAAHICGRDDRTALRVSGVNSGNVWLTTLAGWCRQECGRALQAQGGA